MKAVDSAVGARVCVHNVWTYGSGVFGSQERVRCSLVFLFTVAFAIAIAIAIASAISSVLDL